MTSRTKQAALLYLALMGLTSGVVGFRAYTSEPARGAAVSAADPPSAASQSHRAGSRPSTTAGSPAKPTTGTQATTKPSPQAQTVTGKVVSTQYGPVQVSVKVTGSKITDVKTLQTPSSDDHSVQIAERATPVLRQEVLAAQSAQVNTVSGATYTSQGYARSVQSALDAIGF